MALGTVTSPAKRVVAGSNPAERKFVAQLVEHLRSVSPCSLHQLFVVALAYGFILWR